jgi:serine/threonine protein kinase/Tfp pilus assembly protein PilF
MIGKQILHYQIREKLGEGGMGVVYLAEDTKLKRQVAIKFLPSHIAMDSDERKRFEIEAQAAAALNHPNIAHIYAIEETDDDIFIAMEYIQGQELKSLVGIPGSIAIDDVLDYAKQIVSALQTAHEKGIVHRDIKSANIMVTDKGRIKIMDFGLAKFAVGGVGKTPDITKVGSTLGTVAYMSPEQARGDEVDHRSDIWSFGVVLYELLCGKFPFQGDYEQATIYSILNNDPEPFSESVREIPANLQRVINRTLVKEPAQRFQSCTEIIDLLVSPNIVSETSRVLEAETTQKTQKLSKIFPAWFVGGIAVLLVAAFLYFNPFTASNSVDRSQSVQFKKLAVLPFKGLQKDPQTDFLGFSLADQIITRLNYVKSLAVRPSDAIRPYENRNTDLTEAAADLDVEVILTGSYLLQGDRFRLNAQLVDVDRNEVLWSEPLDVQYDNIFSLQDSISQLVVAGLQLHLSPEENTRIQESMPQNPRAYEYMLRARAIDQNTQKDWQLTIEFLQKAIKLDSTYAQAWGFLGWSYKMYAEMTGDNAHYYQRAEQALNKALRFEGDIGPFAGAIGNIYADIGRTEDGAGLILKSLQARPNDAQLYGSLGYLYRYAGLLDLSRSAYLSQIKFDSREGEKWNARHQINKGTFYSGNYSEAVRTAEQIKNEMYQAGKEIDVSDYFYLGFWNYNANNIDSAIEYFDMARQMDPNNTWSLFAIAYKSLISGNKEKARQIVAESEKRNIVDSEMNYRFTHFYTLLGDTKNALKSLRRSTEGGFFCYPYISTDPLLERIRGTEEYKSILKSVKSRHDAFKDKYGTLQL